MTSQLTRRVGVASFIGLLVQKIGIDIKPFANTLLKLLFGAVKEEKSAAVKRAFSGACALVLKHASTSQAQKLIEDTTALHAGDKNSQISCAILLKSFLSTAPDVVSGYYAEILPVIFISRYFAFLVLLLFIFYECALLLICYLICKCQASSRYLKGVKNLEDSLEDVRTSDI